MKPILALDVDGPLVLMGNPAPHEVIEAWAGPLPVTLARALPRRLERLHARFQIVWSSSWGKRASHDIAPLVGLPRGLPYLQFGRGRRGGHSYKLPLLSKFLGDFPAAVVDDEIGHDMREWAAARVAPTLLVEVDPRRGLVDDEVERLLRFAEAPGGFF